MLKMNPHFYVPKVLSPSKSFSSFVSPHFYSRSSFSSFKITQFKRFAATKSDASYPRFKSDFTTDFQLKIPTDKIPTYRVMDENAKILKKENEPKDISKETILKM